MPFVGISIMSPIVGQGAEVERISKELMSYAKTLEGCIAAYALRATDGSGDVCRVSVWESSEDANRGIMTIHAMALRAELHLKIQPGHIDRGFTEIE